MPLRPRSHLRRLAPYEWEASAAEVAHAAGIPESAVVRFDLNTTPWPPVAWEETLRSLPTLPVNEYVHPSNEPLRSALAEHVGVPPGEVVVTNGADEGLYLVASAFLGPRRRAVLPTPGFAMFRVVTETVGGTLLQVPLDDAWDVPTGPLLEAVSQPEVTVVWLCSPNNPTGRVIESDLIAAVARRARAAVVVVDEAYYEIAGATSLPMLQDHPNLLVIRTFSKGYGLAGARVGYAVGSLAVTKVLEAVRLPQNLSAFGIEAARHALADQSGLERRVGELRRERGRLSRALAGRGWQIVPSEANFVLARPPSDAPALARWLQGAGLVVRSYPGHPRLGAFLRITLRSPEEDDRLLARLDEAPG